MLKPPPVMTSLAGGDFYAKKGKKKSSIGIYHIVIRRINKQMIFEDNEDYGKIN